MSKINKFIVYITNTGSLDEGIILRKVKTGYVRILDGEGDIVDIKEAQINRELSASIPALREKIKDCKPGEMREQFEKIVDKQFPILIELKDFLWETFFASYESNGHPQ